MGGETTILNCEVPGYAVGEWLGGGGFGDVFAARHLVIGRDVAIKVLHTKYSADPRAVARFVAEARAVNQISHPAIVEIFDFGQLADGRQYYVMERLRGATLRDVLRDRGHIPLAAALPMLTAIAEAVDAAHAAHRDLKPENIFVTEGGIKLIDFGLAKLTHEPAITITETNAVFGTPLYMSPEQCRGRAVTVATDAYSFGVLAYHVLTGEPPFSGDPIELALHHLNDLPTPPSELRPELGERVDRVILALLAKEAEQRPLPIAPAISAIVEGALPARPRSRRRWLPALGVAVIASAIGTGVLARRGCVEPSSNDCASPDERLAGIWDSASRERIHRRFSAAARGDVDATWRVLSDGLDRYAGQWRSQWASACRADDRATDPLLYAQRLTCLDNAVLALHGYADSIGEVDVVAFSEGFVGWLGLPVLRDCQSTPVLRAQTPAPPAELRERVGKLVSLVYRGRADQRTGDNAQRPALAAQGVAELERAASELDALKVPQAAFAWNWLAHQQVGLVRAESDWNPIDSLPRDKRVAHVREVLATATQRATEYRDDVALAELALSTLDLELKLGDAAKIDAALDRAEQAVARAGRPLRADCELTGRRARVAAKRGDVATARAMAMKSLDLLVLTEPVPFTVANARANTTSHLAYLADDLQETIAQRREYVALCESTWGPVHRYTVDGRSSLARILDIGGAHEAALAEYEHVLAIDRDVNADAAELAAVRTQIGHLRWTLGDRDGAMAELGQIPPTNHDAWVEVSNLAMARGQLELATWAIDKVLGDTLEAAPDADVESWAAYIAFMHGDVSGVRQHAARATQADHPRRFEDPTSWWWVVYADHVQGRPNAEHLAAAERASTAAEADARLAQQIAPFVGRAHVAIVDRRWADAVADLSRAIALERTIGAFADQKYNWDLAEFLAFYGHALVGAGDHAAALAPLDESLAILDRCCDGFNYYSPMAQLDLAEALWKTGGDRGRARSLAALARDGFTRIGPFKDPDRQRAIRWLAEHEPSAEPR